MFGTHEPGSLRRLSVSMALALLVAALLSAADAQAQFTPEQAQSIPPAAFLKRQVQRPEVHEAWRRAVQRHQQQNLPLPVFVKVLAPNGVKVTFYDSKANPHVMPLPATVGLRARHRYAFAIQGIEEFPERQFFGTIEVLRGVRLPEGAKGSDLYIPLRFNDEDVFALIGERMITKVIVLENPLTALGTEVGVDETLRIDSTLSENTIATAKSLGKLMMVVRIGNRIPEKQELVGVAQARSLLVPRNISVTGKDGKERDLPEFFVYADAPQGGVIQASHLINRLYSHPPVNRLPIAGGYREACRHPGMNCGPQCNHGRGGALQTPGWPVVDLSDPEYLCDGGDTGLKAGRGKLGRLVNVNPSDTVAEYRDAKGKLRFTESNRVCVYAPRYAEVRQLQISEGYQTEFGIRKVSRERMADVEVARVGDLVNKRYAQSVGARGRSRASGYVARQWEGNYSEVRVIEGFENRANIGFEGSVATTRHLSQIAQLELKKRIDFTDSLTKYEFPKVVAKVDSIGKMTKWWKHQQVLLIEPKADKPSRLKIEKLASKSEAKVGEEVTFTITYTNTGDETLTGVAVIDSLLSRLEYVENSAESSRDAVFTAEDNDVGSHLLRWEIKEPLKGGESGSVKFTVRIR